MFAGILLLPCWKGRALRMETCHTSYSQEIMWKLFPGNYVGSSISVLDLPSKGRAGTGVGSIDGGEQRELLMLMGGKWP